MPPLKILHILDHSIPLHSGYTFRTRAILEQQRKRGWQTFHVTSCKHIDKLNQTEELVDGLKFYRSTQPNGLLNSIPVLNQWAVVQTLAQRLDEIISQIKPDILHAHSPALNGLAALKAGKKHNLPVVYECRAFWEDAAVDHGTTTEGSLRYRLTHALESYVFKQADAITTICEGLRQDIVKRGIAEDKVTVIPNAVDLEKFKDTESVNPELQNKLGLKGKIVLGFIGSFYAYEGLLLLLEALPEIVKKRPDIKLLLVGGGSQEEAVKQKAGELGLEEFVIFTGRVPHDEVQDYYNLVNIFVYPRLPMRLTELVTPLKPLEAMAQGRLVVASDVGGHKELIKDRYNGYLFGANDAHALAKTVLALLDNQASWDALCQHGREFVEQQRNWSKSVSFYENVYQSLVNK